MTWMKAKFRTFHRWVTKSTYNIADDVYFLMFLCDVACVVVIIFGYNNFVAMGSGSEKNLATAIVENDVPLDFILLLLFMFICMLIDRAFFLRRLVFEKFIYQIILVVGIHVWMFFILPRNTNRPFADNISTRLWYFFKCLYFALSAYQIRCHYPSRIMSHFLMKKPGYTSVVLFMTFRSIPFLLELRYLMDWMWTDTSLGLFHWVELEDIYNNAFILQCFHHGEDQYVTRRATKRSPIIKYGIGGMFLFLLFFIIWFPLIIFSFAGTVFRPQTPEGSTLSLHIGRYKALYVMKVQEYNRISKESFDFLKARYATNQFATGFLTSYTQDDVYIADIDGRSDTLWEVPPSTSLIIHDHLTGNNSISVYASVKLPREAARRRRVELQKSLLGPTPMFHHLIENEYVLDPFENATRDIRLALAEMVNPNENKLGKKTVSFVNAFPRVLLLSNMIGLRTVNSLDQEYVNLTMQLHRGDGILGWWQMRELRNQQLYQPESGSNKKALNDTLQLLLFNDRAAYGFLSIITGFGVVGLYMSLVLMVGRLVRMLTQNLSYQVAYMETPYVGRILNLCRDIYIARESGELALEEELFAKLSFIYRSPQTLIKMTRYKTE